MNREIRSCLLLLDEGFDRAAWHGPNLLGLVRGLTLEQLIHRPRPGAHNIWELVVHCAYWKYAVRNRLLAGRRNTFPLEGSNFFARNEGLTLADWKKDLALLKREHAALRETIAALDPATFDSRVRNSRHSIRRTVLGVAAHDIYHAGQIAILKRMR